MVTLSSIARSVLPGSVLQALRGRQNSVVQRFYTGPRERTSLFLSGLYGKTYIDWYASRLDKFTGRTGEELAKSEYLATGREHLDVLVRFGMKPHHFLYEFGTGQARSSQHFIEYLDPERFFGNDISGGRIKEAVNLLTYYGLMEKRPTFFVSKSNDFSWIDTGQKFDFFWCNAVLDHMPESDVRETLKNLRSIMSPTGIALIADCHADNSDSVIRHTVKDWFRPAAWYCNIGRESGFEAEDVSGFLPAEPNRGFIKNVRVGADGNFTISAHLVKLIPGA